MRSGGILFFHPKGEGVGVVAMAVPVVFADGDDGRPPLVGGVVEGGGAPAAGDGATFGGHGVGSSRRGVVLTPSPDIYIYPVRSEYKTPVFEVNLLYFNGLSGVLKLYSRCTHGGGVSIRFRSGGVGFLGLPVGGPVDSSSGALAVGAVVTLYTPPA